MGKSMHVGLIDESKNDPRRECEWGWLSPRNPELDKVGIKNVVHIKKKYILPWVSSGWSKKTNISHKLLKRETFVLLDLQTTCRHGDSLRHRTLYRINMQCDVQRGKRMN